MNNEEFSQGMAYLQKLKIFNPHTQLEGDYTIIISEEAKAEFKKQMQSPSVKKCKNQKEKRIGAFILMILHFNKLHSDGVETEATIENLTLILDAAWELNEERETMKKMRRGKQ